MSGPFVFSRRRFLQTAGGFSALSLAASMDKLGLASAAAQASGYKALVCVFLFGGNDSSNMVIPDSNYAQYLAARDIPTGINIPQASLLTISPTNTGGQTYGLHPTMPELQALFNQGKCAIVANSGSLTAPITRTQYLASKHAGIPVPSQLFSHSDQQRENMTTINEASLTAPTGWAGRLGDVVASMNTAGRAADVDVVLRRAGLRQRRHREVDLAADRGRLRVHRRRPDRHAERAGRGAA